MGLMDKLKNTANEVASKAQDGIARGQQKFDTNHQRTQTMQMFQTLGQAYYVQRMGRASAEEVEAIISVVLPHIEAAEATMGQVPLPQAPAPYVAGAGGGQMSPAQTPADDQGWATPAAPPATSQWGTTPPAADQWATPAAPAAAPPESNWSTPAAPSQTSWATPPAPPEGSWSTPPPAPPAAP
jgi:hypothetical protein